MTAIRSREADLLQRARSAREQLVVRKPPANRDPAELVPCRRHPDWAAPTGNGPRPPLNSDGSSPLCPYCREEADLRAGREKAPRPIVDAVKVDLFRGNERDEQLWDAHQEKLRDQGLLLSDQEEETALARIDQLRDEDRAGRIRGAHPDLGGDWHYRHHASDRELKRRRTAARRHWKKYALR